MKLDPKEVGGLVAEANAAQEWMREPDWAESFGTADIIDWMNKRPTSLLPRLIAALETFAAAKADADLLSATLLGDLLAERDAHAETKRERDKWERHATTGDQVLARTRDKLALAEAQRDEALKALDEADAIIEEMVAAENEWQCNPADDERIASAQSRASVYLATRRVREGGKVDG